MQERVKNIILQEKNMLEKIKLIISAEFDIDTSEVTENTSFHDDLGMVDSMDGFEFIMAVEEIFDVEFDDELFDNTTIKTVGDVMQVLVSMGVR